MTSDLTSCPICDLLVESQWIPGFEARRIACKRCGTFEAQETLLMTWEPATLPQLLPYLSAYTRQAFERGEIVRLTLGNWRDCAERHESTSVSEKMAKFLGMVGARSRHPGAAVTIQPFIDYPLVDASSEREFQYFLNHFTDRRFLIKPSGPHGPNDFALSIEGWKALEPPESRAGIPGTCFVAMAFDPSLTEAYDKGIQRAVFECGCKTRRVDLIEHNEKICDKILGEIRLCQFMVADFTLQRGGVYFEAGFAMGLGRAVIWTCREDDRKNLHFDTRQYNHIFWKDPSDLYVGLKSRILATIPSRT